MTLNSKTAVSATVVWALAVASAGMAAGLSPFGWAAAAGVALLPAYVVARMRDREDPSMSQRIQKALR